MFCFLVVRIYSLKQVASRQPGCAEHKKGRELPDGEVRKERREECLGFRRGAHQRGDVKEASTVTPAAVASQLSRGKAKRWWCAGSFVREGPGRWGPRNGVRLWRLGENELASTEACEEFFG